LRETRVVSRFSIKRKFLFGKLRTTRNHKAEAEEKFRQNHLSILSRFETSKL